MLVLIELLPALGSSCKIECCLADFDLSDSVGVLDLIDLLRAFGMTCP